MLQIKEDDKFFTRLLSKESNNSNMGCPSFRVYYGGASDSVAVPFVWEDKPGTPKHSFSHSDIHDDQEDRESSNNNSNSLSLVPPLTPPPPLSPFIQHPRKKKGPTPSTKLRFLVRLFLRVMNRVRFRRQISSGVSSSLSTSLSSQLGSSTWFDYVANGEEEEEEEDHDGMRSSPKSILCFRFVGHQTKTN